MKLLCSVVIVVIRDAKQNNIPFEDQMLLFPVSLTD